MTSGGAPQVRPAGGSPVVGELAHGRRWRDRIDRDHLAQRVGDACGGLVPVDAGGLDVGGGADHLVIVGAEDGERAGAGDLR